jgi:phosphate transport system protein
MPMHLQRAIDHLKKMILSVGAMVEDIVHLAVKSIEECDVELAEKVKKQDAEIDAMEVEVEEECLKILALHQPVAIDLRFIIATLKINNDLERIGDLAVNIANRVLSMGQKEVQIPYDFPAMSDTTKQMLKWSLDALVNLDIDLARTVLYMDDEIDNINRNMYSQTMDCIRKDLKHLEQYILYLSISRYMERIADHITNIAEDVIYMVEGNIVRHRMESMNQ